MALPIEQLRENYTKFHEVKLRLLALYEYNELDALGQQVLVEELISRNLYEKYKGAIEIWNTELSEETIEEFIDKVHTGKCPICDKNNGVVNGGLSTRVVSVILFTFNDRRITVGCQSCLNKELNQRTIVSLFAGWWALPMGVYYTLATLFPYFKRRKQNGLQQPNQYLQEVVMANIIALMHAQDDPEEYQRLLINHMQSV